MFVSLVVVTVLLSAILLISAGAKSLRTRHITEQMSTLEVPQSLMNVLIGAQAAGAAGAIAGLWWGPVGIAAAIGLTLYFAGAVAAHLRVGDRKGAPPAAVLTVVSVALLVLRAATL
ncbi:DoxX family protein [Streptomyces sp. NBC_01218]|uniref:DoxX family protein n=1 Tax=unclassified Streptomyces TaxID=2593676 RepID=UPI0023B9B815|nr:MULTISPECIES: DoxX family protein [unclassified Streptomyces]WEH41469.1 DoxX family protein [Streptomyces sp. AM 2-1-1]WSQ53098.1 DoxX family protein [Streptomyces sp. NBC_01218]